MIFPINRPHLYQAMWGAPNFFSASGVIFGQGRDLVNIARGTGSRPWPKRPPLAEKKFGAPHTAWYKWGQFAGNIKNFSLFFFQSLLVQTQKSSLVPRSMFTRSRPWPKITPLAEKKFGAPRTAWYKWGRFMGNIKYKLALFSYPVFSGTKAKLQTCLPKVD